MGRFLQKLTAGRLRRSKRAKSFISPQLLALESWSFENLVEDRAALLSTPIGRLWKEIPNGHKWLNYFPVYEQCFSQFVGKNVKVLEIGVLKGSSLHLWKRYFGAAATIVGLDIAPECAKYDQPTDSIYVRTGSQADPNFLAKVIAEFGLFNLIIDDGSHVASHQIAAFNSLFDQGLTTGGLYLIEDVETAYWGDRTGQLDIEVSIVDFAEAIIDLMHHPFTSNDYGTFLVQNLNPKSELIVPRVTKLIDQIRFFGSIIVFYKNPRVPPMAERLW